ncbi:MAG: hypothetical protein EOM91_12020 [Sphingobacteriia bacterium]|nr:hypothetical protein [Sphingobacteriia bacterium]NCC39386.1 hypothetical protein [Gammaproteobacteria bacterium]
MTHKNRRLILGLALAMAGFHGIAGTVAAETESTKQFFIGGGCTNQSLFGTYLFEYIARPAGSQPIDATVGFRYFNGRGAGQMMFATAAGEIQTEHFSYTLNPDCTGAIDYAAGTTSEQIFVHPRGEHFTWIDTRPGFAATGQDWRSSRQAPGHCSNATLKGTYNLSGRGNAGSPQEPIFYSEAGMDAFDGNGQVWARYRVSNGEEGLVAGTYRVDADCTGQVTFAPNETYRIFVGPTGADLVSVGLGNDFETLGSGNKISSRMLVGPNPDDGWFNGHPGDLRVDSDR